MYACMLRDGSLQLAVVGVSFAHYLCVVRRCVRSVRCHKKLGIPEMPLAYVWFLRSIYRIMCIAQYQLLCVGKNASPTSHTFQRLLICCMGCYFKYAGQSCCCSLKSDCKDTPFLRQSCTSVSSCTATQSDMRDTTKWYLLQCLFLQFDTIVPQYYFRIVVN